MVKSYYRWDHELLISALICGILTYIENASHRKERFGMGENMELGELRKELDGIDSQLADLYEKRMDICSQVADYKIKTSKSVYDPEREAQKIEAIGNLAHNEFNSKGLEELLSIFLRDANSCIPNNKSDQFSFNIASNFNAD